MYSLLCIFSAVFLKCQKQDLWEFLVIFFFFFCVLFPCLKLPSLSLKNWNLVHSVGNSSLRLWPTPRKCKETEEE